MNAGNQDDNLIHELGHINEIDHFNIIIDSSITKEEIEKAMKKLKNKKSSEEDQIVNKYLKHSFITISDIYVKLFNVIFNSGIIPEQLENIIPVYKNKGGKIDPIFLDQLPFNISCFGKLFTPTLNTSLNDFSDDFCLICESQGGFRKGYSTTDNSFISHMSVNIMKCKKKKLFRAFIDFAAAFDTGWRDGLWTNF